ncbi:DUF993 family protein [Curtobacterium sp. L1-20]|uniref:DUF993 family protein n=1 Tax=Curtobacterium sp. L1-20 TaxID=3138181 RepID=UPI003B52461A
MTTINLPTPSGGVESFSFRSPAPLRTVSTPPRSRRAFAAAHVVADPLRAAQPIRSEHIDWEATMGIRRRLWGLGLGVAESMDTAQRGMGLSAADAMVLAQRTLAEDPRGGAGVVVGIATDALPDAVAAPGAIADAYIRQLETVETGGGTAVIMASRHLVRTATSAKDYLDVYGRVLAAASRPVILHWLGEVFDPALRGYWGSTHIAEALGTVIELITSNPGKVTGIKISLLDARWELELRDRLPADVALFTGDDYNYVDMIAGDGVRHSHALLGAFAAVAPHASAALAHLDAGDEAGFRSVLEPTQRLSRLVFEPPTPFYKVGVVWLAYLSGLQEHFRMLGGMESGRDLLHLAQVVREAGTLGLFTDPDAAAARANAFFAVHGIG